MVYKLKLLVCFTAENVHEKVGDRSILSLAEILFLTLTIHLYRTFVFLCYFFRAARVS